MLNRFIRTLLLCSVAETKGNRIKCRAGFGNKSKACSSQTCFIFIRKLLLWSWCVWDVELFRDLRKGHCTAAAAGSSETLVGLKAFGFMRSKKFMLLESHLILLGKSFKYSCFSAYATLLSPFGLWAKFFLCACHNIKSVPKYREVSPRDL